MNNGGYHLIDLSGYVLGLPAINIPGIYAEIDSAMRLGKYMIMLSVARKNSVTLDIMIPSSVCRDAQDKLTITANRCNANASENYFWLLEVTANDNIALRQTDVTNP